MYRRSVTLRWPRSGPRRATAAKSAVADLDNNSPKSEARFRLAVHHSRLAPLAPQDNGLSPASRILDHPVLELADLLDPQLDHIAGFKELAAPGAGAGGRTGENDVAGMQRHAGRQLRDLLGQGEDHLAGIGILLEHAVDPQFQPELLRIADVACRHDPGPERAGPVEGLVLGPVPLERRGVGHVG